jgi:Ohr subfamily peroxiredoxin
MAEKLLFTGETHVTGGREGAARSADGSLDLKLPAPHPAAENLFATAWSACFIGALEFAASQRKVKLPETPSIDAKIDLILADNEFFLRARLDVHVPGIDQGLARELVDAAHQICPYSKATRGNIDVTVNLV